MVSQLPDWIPNANALDGATSLPFLHSHEDRCPGRRQCRTVPMVNQLLDKIGLEASSQQSAARRDEHTPSRQAENQSREIACDVRYKLSKLSVSVLVQTEQSSCNAIAEVGQGLCAQVMAVSSPCIAILKRSLGLCLDGPFRFHGVGQARTGLGGA